MNDIDAVVDRLTWEDDDIVALFPDAINSPSYFGLRKFLRERFPSTAPVIGSKHFIIVRPFMTSDGVVIYPESEA